ncbi:MAG: hypothetical protein NT123_24575 [Proteobacteria bacterium]|nr:hypothetical protein [Pseudomonadota bacterium]
MTRFTVVVLLCGLALTAGFANGEEKKYTPIEEFRSSTEMGLMICQLEAKTAFSKARRGELQEPYSEIDDCLDDVKKIFSRAHAHVAKKPEASKYLKEYYAVWLTALNGILPSENERAIDYERRQGDASRKADEAWNRFEIETGL